MNPVWTVVVVMAAFLVVLHLKNRGKRRARPVRSYARRIEGFQVVAYLQPEISAACLFDHGMQFGRGFRRKEGPQLPHGPHCRCSAVPFSFNSSEVFHGALREATEFPGSIAGLPREISRRLFATLKRLETAPPASDEQAFFRLAELETFPDNVKTEIEGFLGMRYRHLQSGGGETPPRRAKIPAGRNPAKALER